MVVYADTSFLFSLYVQDAHTSRAAQLGAALEAPLVFTALQRHELRNAFRLAVFRRDMTPAQGRVLLDTLAADLQTGALVETPVAWAEVYATAEALSAAHTGKLGTRAADVLHVAVATALGAQGFYTFDARQHALAAKAGLQVKP
ncbi:MAG: type II toxin-antitoxin system VapC family toxin [Kiritimatiellaeota bacterium]|nr:type II toxin-antitoxin system VapC family toxin [Kiritimatiellota bacterium]